MTDLVELLCESPGDSLQFSSGVGLGVQGDSSFTATEGDVASGAFPGHESSKSLDLVHVNVGGVSHATLSGESVVRVLSSVARKDLVGAVVHSHSEVRLDDRLAGEHEVEDSFDGLN